MTTERKACPKCGLTVITDHCGNCGRRVASKPMQSCPWDDCIYPTCNSAMGCTDDAHTTPLRKPAAIKTVINVD